MHEWALLIFTICMQAAIGGTLMLALFYKKISTLGEERTFKVMKLSLIVFAALSIVGLAASFAHLGSPLNALNTIRNIGSSWMSREILFTGLFIAAIILTLVLALAKKKVSPVALVITALIGLVDIFCMGAIYSASLVSGWNSVHTFTSFYGTALVLGAVLAVSLLLPALRGSEELGKGLVKYSFITAVLGIAFQLVGVALFATAIPEVNMINGMNAITMMDGYQSTVAIRWVIEVIGVGILGYIGLSFNRKPQASFAYAALLAVLVAEGMSRYLFYVLGA